MPLPTFKGGGGGLPPLDDLPKKKNPAVPETVHEEETFVQMSEEEVAVADQVDEATYEAMEQYEQNNVPPQGNPFPVDQFGRPTQDQFGNPINYDPNGNPFRYDPNGNVVYLDQYGNPLQQFQQQVPPQNQNIGGNIPQQQAPQQAPQEPVEEEVDYDKELWPNGMEEAEDEFIDKKKRRMIPLGGKKSKKKVKAKDFDNRKNQLTTVRLLRLFMMIFFVGVFIFGAKNTFFPSHVYTKEDIENISLAAIGQTGFPVEKGQAFAEQFTQAYFNLDSEDDNSKKILSSFYGGSTKSDSQPGAVTNVGKAKQNVLVTPTTFNRGTAGENIGFYHVATLISDRNGQKFNDKGETTAKWVGLAVTVYYDKKTDQLTIAKDSPQLIPSYSVASNLQLPQGEKLGTGQSSSDKYEEMAPTINGFLKAFGNATPESHADIDQYVKSDPEPEVYHGFGGKFAVREDELSGTKAEIYPVSAGEDNKEWKVDLDLRWHDTSANTNDNDTSYRGRYIMTLEQSKDGKYFVSTFRPYVYTPDMSQQ